MQRFNCIACNRCFNERTGTVLAGLKTRPREVERVIAALDEGMGVLGVERVFHHAEATVKRWLLRAGRVAENLQRRVFKRVFAGFLQLDAFERRVRRVPA